MKKLNGIIILITVFIALLVFKQWFFMGELASGDWIYRYSETIKYFPLQMIAWDPFQNGGLGGNTVFLLGLNTYFNTLFSLFFNYVHFPEVIIERLVWFWPYLLLSTWSSYTLYKKLFNNQSIPLLASLVYVFNSYALLTVSGGQVGVALAYALTPFVFSSFIELFTHCLEGKNKNILLRDTIQAVIVLSIQLVFDARFSYMVAISLMVYSIYLVASHKCSVKQVCRVFLCACMIPMLMTVLVNSYWLIPLIFMRNNVLNNATFISSTSASVKFFSFATFENSFGLMHPNWPENIFGKVSFMKPEFILLPLLAYFSLVFLKNENAKKQKNVLYFALLGLLGIFLAKGANDPFGSFYLWAFVHIPGFKLFRDPTKWYELIAISYSILIPYTIYRIYHEVEKKNKNYAYVCVLVLCLVVVFPIRQVIIAKQSGTLSSKTVPQDYVLLEKYLTSKNHYFRTLWLPTTQTYSFYSANNPAVSAENFFQLNDVNSILKKLQNNQTKSMIDNAAIKYIIVASDPNDEIFLKNRKYSEALYQRTLSGLEHIPWLGKPLFIGKIAIFSIQGNTSHFWLLTQKGKKIIVNSHYNTPGSYTVSLSKVSSGDILMFSEQFDPSWEVLGNTYAIPSKLYQKVWNSFSLSRNGDYSVTVYYQVQDLVSIGETITVLTIVFLLFYWYYLSLLNKTYD